MKKLLKRYFGYDDFRPLQEEIINTVLNKKDTFVLMPTGGGKSLCFQLPALKLPGITLVISPLIALMKDQVDSLKSCGIEAEFINSSLEQNQIGEIYTNIKNGKTKIIYIAPERFALSSFSGFIKDLDISLIAIDEAHCISEWGHDFRPEYRNLKNLKKNFTSIPIIALTATATGRVKKDILSQLNLKDPKIFISSFDRENLTLKVIEKKQAFHKLVNLLKNYKKESVIIYCFSRKETEMVADNLKINGFNARAYHAGLESKKRKLVQDYFIKDEVNIIVATIAFGMGIDKPNVRLVVHYTFPKTLEGYYQEIGRAGRDGLPSECVLFYTYADVRKHEFFINQLTNTKNLEQSQEKLSEVLNFTELLTCRKKYLLNYFGEELKKDNCGACDNCLTIRELFDATEIAKKILSTVVRTYNKFGKSYIIEILLGKKTQRVIRNNHDKLSVYNIVKNFSADELGQIINYITNLGLLLKNEGKYPTLLITKKGAEFLQSDQKLEIPKPKKEIKIEDKKNLDYNSELFEILRNVRKQLADNENVPPYVIFGDKSLQEMSYYFPIKKESFLAITGVGALKIKKYGKNFLDKIKEFIENNNITPKEIPREIISNKVIKLKENKPEFYNKTKELLIKNIPIERIAKKQDKKLSTIINHIEKLLDAGEKIDLEYLKLPTDKYELIKRSFEKYGDEFLKPVFEDFKGKYSYDDIKLVRVLMRT